MMFIAIKTKDGVIKGKLSFYCRMLGVSRQGFYKYLAIKDRPWKYQDLADAMRVIHAEDECNDTYGRIRMYQALLLKNPTGIKIPSERTVYRVMDEIGLVHRPKRKPNGITKADREARKSDDLLKREFKADKPLEKCVTDITEIKAKDGKLYVSAIFDCFDSSVLGLAMETNMKATLCEHTLDNAYLAHPDLRLSLIHISVSPLKNPLVLRVEYGAAPLFCMGSGTFWGGFYRSCSCLFTGLRSLCKIWSILPLTVCKRRYSSRFAR